ncbi:M20/M25/M40 family metallo-hydrolase [Nakamurella antarctica]|uniref:M20/M25/M40 family metallo-hydrolase n=1 Tax=Nakamurella antarctica TaxID=1902245 RepID=A0A3G8ZX22_9ACTN|nr:M20/M25/M40 family metallo-hydrolase [Nakamurella antarctica]AZI58211.1 M20/M25/M40 family metallo-hydrolase [Nakamurella antarctica]
MSEPVLAVIDAQFQHRVIGRLQRLVEHESPSGDIPALQGFVGLLKSTWEDLGIAVTVRETPGGPVLVGDLPGRGWGVGLAPILLIGHSDTVWPMSTLGSRMRWSHDEQGVIWGPGVFDMKSGLVIIEFVIECLRGAGSGHPPLRIFVAPDEETGSTHSRVMLEEAAIGCSSAVGFESPHPDGRLKIGRFGSTRLRVRVTGREAHAALDAERGISAIDELVDQLLVIRSMVAAATDPEHLVLLNVGSVEAPGKTNVVSSQACAQIGLRFARKDEEDVLVPALLNLAPIRLGAGVEVVIESHRPAWSPHPRDTELGARLLPGQVPGSPARGAADTNAMAGLDIAAVDGLGARGAGAHALEERIVAASLWDRISSLVEAFGDEKRWAA